MMIKQRIVMFLFIFVIGFWGLTIVDIEKQYLVSTGLVAMLFLPFLYFNIHQFKNGIKSKNLKFSIYNLLLVVNFLIGVYFMLKHLLVPYKTELLLYFLFLGIFVLNGLIYFAFYQKKTY